MGKIFNTIIVGAASGAAAAYFLGTEKGKEVVAKVKAGVEAYQADPESYHRVARDKVNEYKDMAVDTFSEYKGKWESGEFSADNLSKAVKDTVNQVKEKVASVTEESIKSEDVTEKEDIIIDLTPDDITTAEDADDSEKE